MPYKVMVNFGRWPEGALVSGGELMDHMGTQIPAAEKPTRAQIKKLGLTDSRRAIDAARIEELVRRNILQGFGEDSKILTLDKPDMGLPTFDERQRLMHQFNQQLEPAGAQ